MSKTADKHDLSEVDTIHLITPVPLGIEKTNLTRLSSTTYNLGMENIWGQDFITVSKGKIKSLIPVHNVGSIVYKKDK